MIFSAVEARNNAQKEVMFSKVRDFFDHDLSGLKIGIWGLAFKPETDDVREASALNLIRSLLSAGVSVSAYDAKAIETSKVALGELASQVHFADSMEAAIENADALVVMTEWKEFRQPNFHQLSEKLSRKVIFDGRNIYEPDVLNQHGLTYIGIGRGSYLLTR